MILNTTEANKLYTAEQAREIDRIAIQQKGIAGIDLMRKAGQAVFELIKKKYANSHMTVFCGAGNNAGDGYVIAKLALDAGFKISVYYLSLPEQLSGDALIAYQDFVQSTGKANPFDEDTITHPGIIVDALLGTGLDRDVSGNYATAIKLMNAIDNPVISVDIPSGLNANTGNIMGCAVKANYTVSFIVLKQGLFTGYAAENCGQILHTSLDIPDNIIQQQTQSATLIYQHNLPKRHRCTHKGDNGHVLVIGGDCGYAGAIKLAAEAALRVGSGLVTVATRKNHAALINSRCPELMCRGIEEAEQLMPLIHKATIIAIGPGLGQSSWAKQLFEQVLATKKPLVIDADALNLLADKLYYRENWILTPHPGEAARLLKCTTKEIAFDRFAAISQLQKIAGGVVILKGAGSLISNGDKTAISTVGNPGMASGGMGDTLTGIIAGLLAQNLDLYTAATSAVFLHGKAADLSAQQDGEIGLLASDLLPYIRKLVNQ